MQVIKDREQTINLSAVLKHPENCIIVGMIKFKGFNYLYKLVRLDKSEFVWANLSKVCCLNDGSDSNAAVIHKTTEEALAVFMDGHEQHELHAFRTKNDYLNFLAMYL